MDRNFIGSCRLLPDGCIAQGASNLWFDLYVGIHLGTDEVQVGRIAARACFANRLTRDRGHNETFSGRAYIDNLALEVLRKRHAHSVGTALIRIENVEAVGD